MAQQRYKVLKKIDSGGMAEIFLARAHSVGGIEKKIAIKRVLPSLTKNERFVNMFLDEARLAMVLSHANIVTVFDVGHAQDTYFIVMEYVDGYNLRKVFQRVSETGYRIPIRHAVYMMAEVCKGLSHAHEQRGGDGKPLGIVHRDISPPNILISRSGEVKITDFGLAKATTQLELTDPGIVKGKFSYLSPEAANGQTVDHRADLFSVGILLWEMLANRRLFHGKTDMETVELIREANVPDLSLFNKEATPEFLKLVAKGLARDPRDRWHSARDFGDALTDFLFEHTLKVTNFDIAEMLRELFGDGSQGLSPTARIDLLIEEEVLNLSMLAGTDPTSRTEGAQPLSNLDVAEARTDSRLTVSDIWEQVDEEGPASPKLSRALEKHIAEHGLVLMAPTQRGDSVGSVLAPIAGSRVGAVGHTPTPTHLRKGPLFAQRTRRKPVLLIAAAVVLALGAAVYYAVNSGLISF